MGAADFFALFNLLSTEVVLLVKSQAILNYSKKAAVLKEVFW